MLTVAPAAASLPLRIAIRQDAFEEASQTMRIALGGALRPVNLNPGVSEGRRRRAPVTLAGKMIDDVPPCPD